MIRLFVIDDHFLIFDGLCLAFEQATDDVRVVDGSLTVTDALNNISPEEIDIIILDLFIRQENPISNIRKVRRAFPGIPVVILSQETSLFWKIAMFINGAIAYIDKSEGWEATRETLLRVAAGERLVPFDVQEFMIAYQEDINTRSFIEELIEIVLELSRGLNIKQIAASRGKSESTIEKRLKNYRTLFQAKTNIELVHKITPHLLFTGH